MAWGEGVADPHFSSLLLSILELSDTHVYAPWIRALFGTAPRFCEVVVLKLIAPCTQLTQCDPVNNPRVNVKSNRVE